MAGYGGGQGLDQQGFFQSQYDADQQGYDMGSGQPQQAQQQFDQGYDGQQTGWEQYLTSTNYSNLKRNNI